MTRAATPADDDWFDARVREALPGLLAFARRLVASPEDAADTVSEALTVAWRRRDAMPDDPSSARAWLFGIARKCASNSRRSAGRRSALVVRLGAALRADDATIPGADASAAGSPLDEALACLGDADRHLVTLVAWDGFTVAQAGRVLGLKASTARSRYMRSRRTLASRLGAVDRHPTPG